MLTLVVLVCIVDFTEELMFRGVGLVTFRHRHLTEGKVALYSSVRFGAVHLSNALATGSSAIVQAIVVSFTPIVEASVEQRPRDATARVESSRIRPANHHDVLADCCLREEREAA